MLKVGVTGGIGSGKSTVCQVFATLGIPVFYADDAAKYLMNNDAVLIKAISDLFGRDIYQSGILDTARVSAIVFKAPEKLQQLNALVHPATILYSRQWMDAQKGPYAIKEAAIFFESGSYRDMDVMIGVYAPAELRIQRALKRAGATKTAIEERMANQMNEEEKMRRCDYVIINDDATAVIPQVLHLHTMLQQRVTAA